MATNPLTGPSLWPREHGAWGIVSIPFLAAVAIAGRVNAAVLVGALAVLLAFLARYPVELLLIPASHRRAGRPEPAQLRRRAWLTSFLAAAAGLALVFLWKLYVLLWVALAGLALFGLRVWWGRRGADRSLALEVLGSVGLTASALVGWAAATGGLDRMGLLVWGLNAVYFACGIVYVKARIRARLARHQAEPAGFTVARAALAAHLLALALVAGLAWVRWISPLVVVPFVLAAARAGWVPSDKTFALRRLGWSEVALSLVFAVFLTLAFRW